MKTWVKNNKLTLSACILGSPVAGLASYKLLTVFFNLPNWSNILIATVIGLLVCGFLVLLGGDKELQGTFRKLSKVLTLENCKQIIDKAKELLTEQEIHELAIKKIEQEKKEQEELKISAEVQLSESEKNARIEQEMRRIKEAEAEKLRTGN